MKRIVWVAVAALLLVSVSSAAAASITDRIEWVDQFGTPGFDLGSDAAAGDGYVYVTGRVGSGALDDQSSSGGTDAFLRKYAPDGRVVWTRQFGTAGFDGITVTAKQGGLVYIVGTTSDAFPDETSSGSFDIFVATFDTDGNRVNLDQWGTAGFDRPLAVAADSTGLYVLGMTDGTFPGEVSQGGFDLFLAKLKLSGGVDWVRQFGTPANDPAIFALGGVALSGGVFVTSSVSAGLSGPAALGNADAIVAKFDYDGDMVWVRQFGTGCSDLGTGLAIDSGRLVIVGTSIGDMDGSPTARCNRPPGPQRDFTQYAHAYVQLRDLDGSLVWTRQYEGNGIDDGDGFSLPIDVAADADGIYVASESIQTPSDDSIDPACPNRGPQEDVHTRAFGFDGTELWTQVIGTTSTDAPGGIAADDGGVYVTGSTECGLGGETGLSGVDAFLFKIEK